LKGQQGQYQQLHKECWLPSCCAFLGVLPECDTAAFRTFLRMFLPRYGWGYLGKSTALQWAAIQEKLVTKLDLTESSVNAK
jgi:hypothetical protein